MYFINIFAFNLLINNYLLNFLFTNNDLVAIGSLNNLKEDFVRIAFPYNLEINAMLISNLLSLLISILVVSTLQKSNKFSDLILIIREFGKLVFIYIGVYSTILYMLRIYNLSRGLLLVGFIVFPLLSYLFIIFLRSNIFLKIQPSVKISTQLLIIFLIASVFVTTKENNEFQVSIDLSNNNVNSDEFTTYEKTVYEGCSPWLGSSNFNGCITGVQVKKGYRYSESLNNIIVFDSDFYVLDVFGKVFKNNVTNIYLDISEKVKNRIDGSGDQGLFSLAFHPSGSYLLISYSDLENNLVIEKYKIGDNNSPLKNDPEILLKIPNSQCCHFSGSIIWSNYFDDFLISIGDMESNASFEGKPVSLFNSEPLDTTSPRGKIIFLNKRLTNPDLLAVENVYESKKNILAYGLRNPWKTYEYNNYLFVPDIGHVSEEELNILNLDDLRVENKPYLLGWPHYEGTIDNQINFNEIFLHENNTKTSINSYVKDKSLMPKVFYSHVAPENYRAAIIGGAVIEDSKSKYFEHYFFADYLSAEIFSYDFKNDSLKIIPLGSIETFITSLNVHPQKADILLITTGDGELLEVKLP